MCGRYSIYEPIDHYLRQLSLDLVVINGYDHEPINQRCPVDASRSHSPGWGWLVR